MEMDLTEPVIATPRALNSACPHLHICSRVCPRDTHNHDQCCSSPFIVSLLDYYFIPCPLFSDLLTLTPSLSLGVSKLSVKYQRVHILGNMEVMWILKFPQINLLTKLKIIEYNFF